MIPNATVIFGKILPDITESANNVSVPRDLLRHLLDLYVASWDFDEEWYLTAYPDINEAVRQGKFSSGWHHFRATGYFEGRLPIRPTVDSEWYVSAYPDVAQAVLDGTIKNAQDHFLAFGYSEGRFPKDPRVDPAWYRARYGGADPVAGELDVESLSDHFVKIGFRDLALPSAPV